MGLMITLVEFSLVRLSFVGDYSQDGVIVFSFGPLLYHPFFFSVDPSKDSIFVIVLKSCLEMDCNNLKLFIENHRLPIGPSNTKATAYL